MADLDWEENFWSTYGKDFPYLQFILETFSLLIEFCMGWKIIRLQKCKHTYLTNCRKEII
jgi:hypothetical protein